MSTDSTISPALSKRRRYLRLVGFFALLLLVPILMLSQIIQYILPWYLERQGQGIQMEMSEAEVDLLDRRIRLIDLRVGPRNGLALHFKSVAASVNLHALLAGEFPLEDLQFQEGELDLETLQRTARSEGDENSDASLNIPEIEIHDFKLKRVSQWLGREILIKRFYLNNQDSESAPAGSDTPVPRRLPGRLEMQAAIGDAMLDIEGELGLQEGSLSADVRLRIQNLGLEGFDGIFADGNQLQFTGILNADTALKLRFKPSMDALQSHLSGNIDITDFNYQDRELKLALSAKYSGELGMEGPLAEFGSKIDAQGMLNIIHLDLVKSGVGEKAWSFTGRELIYDGDLALLNTVQANGTVQATGAQLRLDSEQQEISTEFVDFAVNYDDGQDGERLAVLTTLKARGLRMEFKGDSPGKLSGRKLAVDELTLNRDFSTGIGTFSADNLAVQDFAGQPNAQLGGARLKKIHTNSGGTFAIGAASATSVEIAAEDFKAQLQKINLAQLQHEQRGGVTVQQLGTGNLAVDFDDRQFKARELEISGFRQFADKQPSADSGGALTLSAAKAADMEITGEDFKVQLQTIDLSQLKREQHGTMTVQQLGSGNLELDHSGRQFMAQGLEITGFQQSADEQFAADKLQLQTFNGDLGAALELSGFQALDLSLDVQDAFNSASLSARRVGLSSGEDSLSLLDARLQDLQYAFKGEVNLASFSAGKFSHQGISGAGATIEQPLLEEISLDFTIGKYRTAHLQFESMSASQPSPAAHLASGSVKLEGLSLDSDLNTDFAQLELNQLQLGEDDPVQVSVTRVDATGLSYRTGGVLSLDTVDLATPVIALTNGVDGVLNLPRLPYVRESADADNTALAVHIAKLSTRDKPGFVFTDTQVEPVYSVHIQPFDLQLEGFDNRPGSASGSFKLTAQTGRFTNLDISGETQAQVDAMDISILAGKLTGMVLKNLSPYTGAYEKFAISEGSGDLTLSGHIVGSTLDLQTEVVISKLEMEPFYEGDSSDPEAEDGSGSLATALMLLSDNNDTVKLKIPVTGTLDEPDFDFSDATAQVVTGVAKGAVLLAIQPLGILVSAAKLAGSLGNLSDEPVLFAPGEAKLGAESITLLDSFAEKLKSEPKLNLQICGRMVKADADALAELQVGALNEDQQDLAKSRSRVVSDYLQQKQLVQAKQLKTVCTEQSEDAEDAQPRAQLKLDSSDLSGPKNESSASVPDN